MEWLIDLLKYTTPPANVNAHSLDIIMDTYIARSMRGNQQKKVAVIYNHGEFILDKFTKLSKKVFVRNVLKQIFWNFLAQLTKVGF